MLFSSKLTVITSTTTESPRMIPESTHTLSVTTKSKSRLWTKCSSRLRNTNRLKTTRTKVTKSTRMTFWELSLSTTLQLRRTTLTSQWQLPPETAPHALTSQMPCTNRTLIELSGSRIKPCSLLNASSCQISSRSCSLRSNDYNL